jgi:hypothetical protein
VDFFGQIFVDSSYYPSVIPAEAGIQASKRPSTSGKIQISRFFTYKDDVHPPLDISPLFSKNTFSRHEIVPKNTITG